MGIGEGGGGGGGGGGTSALSSSTLVVMMISRGLLLRRQQVHAAVVGRRLVLGKGERIEDSLLGNGVGRRRRLLRVGACGRALPAARILQRRSCEREEDDKIHKEDKNVSTERQDDSLVSYVCASAVGEVSKSMGTEGMGGRLLRSA